MAKGQSKSPPEGKLAGKTVALVGKFGYHDCNRPRYANQVTRAGGVVVDAATAVPDILFVGEGRGGKPPAEVAKVQKKSPAVQILDAAGFMQLVIPDREELLQEIGRGRREDNDHFW